MTRNEFPETLYIPGMQLPGKGTIDIQISENNGVIGMLVWGSLEKAKIWLENGGMIAWANNDKNLMNTWISMGGNVAVRAEKSQDFFSLLSIIGGKKNINFEPENGTLFSPPERRASL